MQRSAFAKFISVLLCGLAIVLLSQCMVLQTSRLEPLDSGGHRASQFSQVAKCRPAEPIPDGISAQELFSPNPVKRGRTAHRLGEMGSKAFGAVPHLIWLLDDHTPLQWTQSQGSATPAKLAETALQTITGQQEVADWEGWWKRHRNLVSLPKNELQLALIKEHLANEAGIGADRIRAMRNIHLAIELTGLVGMREEAEVRAFCTRTLQQAGLHIASDATKADGTCTIRLEKTTESRGYRRQPSAAIQADKIVKVSTSRVDGLIQLALQGHVLYEHRLSTSTEPPVVIPVRVRDSIRGSFWGL